MANKFDAKIKVVSAFGSSTNKEKREQLQNQIKQVETFIKKQGIECSSALAESTAEAKTMVPRILKHASDEGDIDLIIIMTQQELEFSEYFIGSHASELIRKSVVPVMSVIPKETGEIIIGF